MTEQQLQTKIITYLSTENWLTWKTIKLNKNGYPDIFGLRNGIFLAIEVKREGQKPTVLQEFRIKEIIKAGGYSFYTDTLKDFKAKYHEIQGH